MSNDRPIVTRDERARYADSLTKRYEAQLSPRERENLATDHEQLEDWTGLITHTIACFITDPPSLVANNWAAQNIWIDVDNGMLNLDVDFSNHAISSESTSLFQATCEKFQIGNLARWGLGEGAGDLLAIPMTVALQRISPETMDIIRQIVEPAVSSFYHESADKIATKWAEKHGVERYSQEFQDYKNRHYEKEMRRLPQAIVWTALSMGIGIVAQKEFAPSIGFDCDESYKELFIGSVIGKAITGIAANVPRIMAPEFTEKSDHFVHHKIAKPTAHIIQSAFNSSEHETISMKDTPQPQLH